MRTSAQKEQLQKWIASVLCSFFYKPPPAPNIVAIFICRQNSYVSRELKAEVSARKTWTCGCSLLTCLREEIQSTWFCFARLQMGKGGSKCMIFCLLLMPGGSSQKLLFHPQSRLNAISARKWRIKSGRLRTKRTTPTPPEVANIKKLSFLFRLLLPHTSRVGAKWVEVPS